jgi:hypothetical protein
MHNTSRCRCCSDTTRQIIQQTDLRAKLFEGRNCSRFASALYSRPPALSAADLAKYNEPVAPHVFVTFRRYSVCNLQLAKIATSEKSARPISFMRRPDPVDASTYCDLFVNLL